MECFVCHIKINKKLRRHLVRKYLEPRVYKYYISFDLKIQFTDSPERTMSVLASLRTADKETELISHLTVKNIYILCLRANEKKIEFN